MSAQTSATALRLPACTQVPNVRRRTDPPIAFLQTPADLTRRAPMNDPPPLLDDAFIARQRKRLLHSRAKLLNALQAHESERTRLQLESQGQALEEEETAQDQMLLDDGRVLADQLAKRLIPIDRALAKIDDGSYGFSDVTGEPIPLKRLEAEPEAITVG